MWTKLPSLKDLSPMSPHNKSTWTERINFQGNRHSVASFWFWSYNISSDVNCARFLWYTTICAISKHDLGMPFHIPTAIRTFDNAFPIFFGNDVHIIRWMRRIACVTDSTCFFLSWDNQKHSQTHLFPYLLFERKELPGKRNTFLQPCYRKRDCSVKFH